MVRDDSGPKIFVSYRHEDTGTHVQYMCEYLNKRFGPGAVFWDKASIESGRHYKKEAIQPVIEQSVVVMVVVFGRNWIYDHEDGSRGPSREVLDEIALATARNEYVDAHPDTDLPKIRFVTVAFDGVSMPKKQSIPATVWHVTDIQAVEMRSGPGVTQDQDRIARIIDDHLKEHAQAAGEARARAAESLIGQVVSDHKVVALIGRGDTGTVYRAENTTTLRPAALKVLGPEMAKNAAIANRLRNEARMANALRHPNVIEITGFGALPNGTPYLLMEYLEGATIAHRLTQKRALPIADAVDFASQSAGALAALHSKGIIHRNLKPDNIFLVPDPAFPRREKVKISDFGIAKFLSPASSSVARTLSGAIMGAPAYMSPEQRWGEEIDQRADIYSLGAVLYEMLCGQRPFGSRLPEDVLAARSALPLPPRSVTPSIPAALEALVLKALAPKKEDRFDSMDALWAALESVKKAPSPDEDALRKMRTTTFTGSTTVVGPRPRTNIWPILAFASAAAVVTGFIVRQAMRPAHEEPSVHPNASSGEIRPIKASDVAQSRIDERKLGTIDPGDGRGAERDFGAKSTESKDHRRRPPHRPPVLVDSTPDPDRRTDPAMHRASNAEIAGQATGGAPGEKAAEHVPYKPKYLQDPDAERIGLKGL